MRSLILFCVAAAVACSSGGCGVRYTEPTTQPAALGPAEKDFDAVWEAAKETLRKYYFELDREDRRAGIITTAPLTGKHFFEFWRKDAARPADFSESTVQTIYRAAKVTIAPTKPGARTYQAQVDVLLYRSDKEANHVTSTSEAYSLFSYSRRGEPVGQAQGNTLGGGLVALGHDRGLEAKLTADIAAAADKARGR